MHQLSDGLQGISLVIIVQQMGHHLSVRVGTKGIASLLQLFLQLQIVLNDTIMHHYNGFICIKMGMGIRIRGRSVSRPAGMADTDGSGQR